jgi:hypothetical protein
MADHEHDEHDEAAPDRTQAEMAARGRKQADETRDEADPDELRREAERLRATLKETTRKATADRLRREELEREKEEREAAKLDEQGRLKRDRDIAASRATEAEQKAADLERRLAELRVDHAIEREAAALFEYPEDVPKLVDRERIEVDPDTGRIAGVKDAVKKLAEQRPGLLRQRAGGGTPPRDSAFRRNANPSAGTGATPEDRAARQLIEGGGYGRF